MLKALREGLSEAAFDSFVTREFFIQLQALHTQAFQGAALPNVTLIEVRENSGAAPPVEAVRLAEDDPDLLKVRQLRIGSWVEFREDEENTLRCKLTAIIAPANSYIFVNRTGLKVLEKTCTELALEFKRGGVRTLDDALLFDRALASVIGSLRQLNRAK